MGCKDCERLIYDLGKAVLGKQSGGVIKKVLAAKGLEGARVLFKMAAEKSDPMEYVGAAMREKSKSNSAAIGEVIKGWMWDGGKWKKVEESI